MTNLHRKAASLSRAIQATADSSPLNFQSEVDLRAEGNKIVQKLNQVLMAGIDAGGMIERCAWSFSAYDQSTAKQRDEWFKAKDALTKAMDLVKRAQDTVYHL